MEKATNPDWEVPMRISEAVGGTATDALSGAAALACMQASIRLVDDMLDNDPRGDYHHLGHGAAANLALALQAVAFRIMAMAELSDERRTAVTAALAQAAQITAYGQQLDIQNLDGEANYWKVTQTKSTPYYGLCYKIGAILGGASLETAEVFYELGANSGEIVQLEDDLTDVFETPANSDWLEGRNNLLILYARTADHPYRQHFCDLLPNVHCPDILQEAQQILLNCGAVSYCLYHLIRCYQTALHLLESMDLPSPTPIQTMLDAFSKTLVHFLTMSGVEVQKEQLIGYQLVL
jgi:geranylgeranyl pyrophosphate synthase